jgi:hypothetical protein
VRPEWSHWLILAPSAKQLASLGMFPAAAAFNKLIDNFCVDCFEKPTIILDAEPIFHQFLRVKMFFCFRFSNWSAQEVLMSAVWQNNDSSDYQLQIDSNLVFLDERCQCWSRGIFKNHKNFITVAKNSKKFLREGGA